MFTPFTPGASWAHRLSPGAKLLVLALAGTGLFFITSAWLMAAFALFSLALFPLTRLPLATAWAQLRPAAALILLLVLAQAVFGDIATAVLVGARFVALMLLAGLVTLTTRTSAMIEVLERGLTCLAPLGVNPIRTALTLSLALRFIPRLADVVHEVREAQRARALEQSFFALAVPTLTRALKLTDDVADAIEARGFDAASARKATE